jgi:hypothetical protein
MSTHKQSKARRMQELHRRHEERRAREAAEERQNVRQRHLDHLSAAGFEHPDRTLDSLEVESRIRDRPLDELVLAARPIPRTDPAPKSGPPAPPRDSLARPGSPPPRRIHLLRSPFMLSQVLALSMMLPPAPRGDGEG